MLQKSFPVGSLEEYVPQCPIAGYATALTIIELLINTVQ
jgi:hypothetical protein